MSVSVPVLEAANRLHVSRRRVQALIDEGRLRARRVGHQWVVPVEELRVVANTLQPGPGRPVSPGQAWRLVDPVAGPSEPSADLDRVRRRVRSRADHRYWYIHPGWHDELRSDPRLVMGGRDAAAHFSPVDADGGVIDVYVRRSDVEGVVAAFAADADVVEGENVRAHVVDDDVWPFSAQDRVAGPWVAWLDLADVLDRAADTVLDRLTGWRARG